MRKKSKVQNSRGDATKKRRLHELGTDYNLIVDVRPMFDIGSLYVALPPEQFVNPGRQRLNYVPLLLYII